MVSQPFQHHNCVNTSRYIEDLLWKTFLGCKWLPPIDFAMSCAHSNENVTSTPSEDSQSSGAVTTC